MGILADLGLMPNATRIAVCVQDVDLTPRHHQLMVTKVTKSSVASSVRMLMLLHPLKGINLWVQWFPQPLVA